jgi:hypothetical protein
MRKNANGTQPIQKMLDGPVYSVRGLVPVEPGLVLRPFDKIVRATPWPLRQKKVFDYSYQTTITSSTTGYTFGSELIIELNNLFTPYSSSSQSVYGMLEYQKFYSQYMVEAFEVDVEFTAPITLPYQAGLSLQSSTDAFTFVGRTTAVDAYPSVFTKAVNVGVDALRIAHSMTIAQLEGLTRAQFMGAISDYAAVMN